MARTNTNWSATLIKEQPLWREATLINVFSFAQFGAFWTTMVLLLSEEPFNFTSTTIGLFGIIGASGALAAPLVGKLSDKGVLELQWDMAVC
jgi:hypothetical protein